MMDEQEVSTMLDMAEQAEKEDEHDDAEEWCCCD